jgi:hypothetical protein
LIAILAALTSIQKQIKAQSIAQKTSHTKLINDRNDEQLNNKKTPLA